MVSLLEYIILIVTISFDSWTSSNNLFIFTINRKWTGPDIIIYQTYLDFVEINRAYSGKNLIKIIYNRIKELNILGKIISLTSNNTGNNNTCTRYLYKLLLYSYNEYLDPIPVYHQEMRFKGKASLIDYIAYGELDCESYSQVLGV